MKRILIILSVLVVGITANSYAQDDSLQAKVGEKSDQSAIENETKTVPETVFAYYLHGTRRCATCRKLEAYSKEALREGFPEMLKDSTLVWGTINYDLKRNEHYLKDYDLYTKALILSRVRDGKEVEWKNLDKIWDLVNDKEKFLEYVREQTAAFMNPDKK